MKKFTKIACAALAASMALSMGVFADEVWKIGGIGPVSGGAAVYGQAVKNAMMLAAEEINAAGGINGYQVEVNFQDDEHDAEKSVNAYHTLQDWEMDILLGTVTSKPCQAVAAETANDNIFQLTPSGSAVACIEYDNAFRVCFSDPAQGAASARYIGEHGLAQKVAIIFNSSDVYSTGIRDTFLTEAAGQGFEVVDIEGAFVEGDSNFEVQLQQAQAAGADLVFLPIYYDAASLILQQASNMGYEPIFFGVDGMDGILDLDGFDKSLAEDVMLLTPFVATADDELTKSFVTKFEENYGGVPNQFAADAYDGMYIIKMAAEKAGLTPDMDPSDICEAMKTAMVEITYDGLTGTGTTWDASGEPTKDPKAMVIKDGIYVAAE